MDVRNYDSDRLEAWTDVRTELILENLAIALDCGIEMLVPIPVALDLASTTQSMTRKVSAISCGSRRRPRSVAAFPPVRRGQIRTLGHSYAMAHCRYSTKGS